MAVGKCRNYTRLKNFKKCYVNYVKQFVFENVWHSTSVVQTKFWEITISYRSLLLVYWVQTVNSWRECKICILYSWLWSTNCLPKSSFGFYLSTKLVDAGVFCFVGLFFCCSFFDFFKHFLYLATQLLSILSVKWVTCFHHVLNFTISLWY